MVASQLASFGLRAFGLAAKFGLIFLLARIMSAEDLGTYGLIAATVAYATYFLGLDYYAHSGRAIAAAEKGAWSEIIRDQMALFGCTYAVFLPALSTLFIAGLLPLEHVAAFYLLLVLEHLSLELGRLLVAAGMPMQSAILVFLRNGGWCVALLFIYAFNVFPIDLNVVFFAWIVSDGIALLVGGMALRHVGVRWIRSRVNWANIGNGLKTALLYLAGTIALRAVFTLDRYAIELVANREMLGVYTLYFGICNAVVGFIDAIIFSFRYPRLISSFRSGNREMFERERRSFRLQTIVALSILTALAAALVAPVIWWIGQPQYGDHLPLFFVMLAGTAMFVLSHIPHYSLYAMGLDKSIVVAHIAALFVFVATSAALAPAHKAMGVALAVLAAWTVLVILKARSFHLFSSR